MRGWFSKLSPLVALAVALVTVTVVIAAYTGPIRPRQVEVVTGWVRSIYRNSPWTLECRCGMGGPGQRCSDNDYYCFCGDAPYNNGALYTCYESEQTTTVTHNPATASGSFTCGTWGDNGWCRGGASLNVSGSEPVSGYSITRMEGNYTGGNEAAVSCSGSSCGFTPPQGQGTFWYWAVSSYGDTSAKNSLAYKFDSGVPFVSLSPSGTLGSNGWYRSNVTVTGSGSDAVSGLAGIAMSCPSCASCGSGSCFIQNDGIHTVTATATDYAGNSATTNLTVRKDTVPPSLSYSYGSNSFYNGWHRSAVQFSASASDATSGVASVVLSCGSNPCSVSAEGQNTVTITATDYAGNSSLMSETVWIDTVEPTVSLSVPPADGLNGWYVSNVTATASGSDATSGIGVVRTRLNNGVWGGSSLTVTTDGMNYVYAQAMDMAGNESDLVYAAVYRDTVPPVASLNIPAPNGQNGWFISNPTVSTGGTDATSGVATRQVRVNGGAWQSNSTVITGDGVHTVEGRAQDYAGHWSSVVSGTVRVDTTPPTASVSLPPVDGQNGWYVSDVAVTAQGTDATSGVASREARLGSGAWQPNGLTVTTDGTHTVTVRVTDTAGNNRTATATVRRDATPPTISGLNVSGTAGNNGWYRSDVEVSGVASDATSGIALVEVDGQPNLTLSEGVHGVLIRAVDEAGNQSTQVATVRVDNTPPILTPQLSPLDGDNGWYVVGASLDAAASDALSGLAEVRVRVDGGAWQSLPLDLTDEGVYAVEIEAEDEAGNLTRENLTVRIDRTAPTINPSIPSADGKNGWYVSPFEVSYSTDDNLSGVQSSAWRLNGGAWQSGTPQIDGEGEIVLDIRAADNAGNERIRRYTFTLDQTPPVGAIILTGEAGVEDWYRSAVEVALTGEDAVSGVAETRIGQSQGLGILSANDTYEAEGWHTVSGEVEDNAGWVTEIRRSFGIDLTPPQGGFEPLPDLLSGTVQLAGDASDALSGLQSLELSFSMGYQWQEITPSSDRWAYEWDTTQTNGGYKRLYLRLTDKAGNRYTTSVDVLVSNALPAAEITREWVITESGQVNITPGDLPIRQVCLTIQDPSSDRKVEWCGDSIEDIPNPVQWDGKFADGTQAAPGQYPVTVQVTDIANRTVTASGTMIIPAPTPTPTAEQEEPTATKPVVIAVLPTATPTPTPTQTPTEEEREEPTRTPPAVSLVLPTPQPTVAVKPPKIEVQAAVEIVRRALWPFLTLIGLAAALGYSAMRDERPQAIRKLAERMERIKDLQEVK